MPEQQSELSVEEHAVRLYRLLRDTDPLPSYEEAREQLGLSDELMYEVVDHLSAVLHGELT